MKKFVTLTLMIFAVGFAANAQKFALIDMEYILGAIPAYERANEQLNQNSTVWQNEIEGVINQAQSLYNAYQSQAGSLSDADRSRREEEIINKEREANELRRKYFGPEGEMAKLQNNLIRPIEDEVYNAVKAVSEAGGYDVVVDRASATSVIFANPRIDISNEVLARLGYSN
ncbi:MAG: OmpH family outer membrane protein [Bacteroides sp.]|nr:OmpH family outer membrane protein [Bacteroides sp.]